MHALERIGESVKRLVNRPIPKFVDPEPSIDQVLLGVYKWIIGSGRIMLFTSRITEALFKKEMTTGSPYFNLEVRAASP